MAEDLPGVEIIDKGLRDLSRGLASVEAHLVSMASIALHSLGYSVPEATIASPERGLYRMLEKEHGDGAHSKYNAWRRRLASFLRAARCARK